MFSEAKHPGMVAGYGCVAAETMIVTEFGLMRIEDIDRPMRVLSWNESNQQFQLSLSSGAFPKGRGNLYRVEGPQGGFDGAGRHHIFSSQRIYEPVEAWPSECGTLAVLPDRLQTIWDTARLSLPEDDLHCSQILAGLMGRCADEARQYGQQFLLAEDTDPVTAQEPDDARTLDPSTDYPASEHEDGQAERIPEHNHHGQNADLCGTDHLAHQEQTPGIDAARQTSTPLLARIYASLRALPQSLLKFVLRHTTPTPLSVVHSSPVLHEIKISILQDMEKERVYYDMMVLGTNNYVCEAGFIHHNSGKSHAAVVRLAILALRYPKMNFAFVEPTFDLIRLIAYPRFMELFESWGITYKLNRADNIIQIENGSQIIFRSADTPERLVGFEVADAVIDEADTLRPEQAADVWSKMLGRCRQKKPDSSQNTLAAVSTPEGFGWMYETFGKELKPGYELIRAPTSSNPYLPDGYVKQLENTYSTAQLAAYLDGQFVNLNAGSVFPGYDRRLNHTSATERPGEPLHIGMDFNVTNMSAIVHVTRDNKPIAVNEIVKAFDTPEMIRIIQERYRGHRIFVYPDASGSARKTNNASISDHALLRAAGFVVCVNTRNPAVKDRILSMNKALEDRTYLINTDRCPMLAESLEKQAYNKNGEPDKGAGFDHTNDAASYFVVYRYPIQSNRPRLALVVGI